MNGIPHLRIGLRGAFFSAPPPSYPGVASYAPSNPYAAIPAAVAPPPSSSGGRMTWEEAIAQFILQKNQTVAGTNHLSADPSQPIAIPDVLAGLITSRGEIRTVKDPALDMPPGGIQFDKANIEGAASAQIIVPAAGAQVTVVQFVVPNRYNGAIKYIANQVVGGGWVEGTGTLIWQLLADGVPVPNYEAMLGSRGTMAAPGPLQPGFIRIFQNQLIQLVLQNVNGAFNQVPVLGLLRGHFYPYELEPKGGSAWM